MSYKDNQIVIYKDNDGNIECQVNLHDNTLWLSQKDMAELFGVKTPAISKHLKNIFNDGELEEKMVVSILETTTKHGAIKDKTQKSTTKYYNLDAIISVGYRVNSTRATQFRIWATNILREYLIKGFSVNEKLLINRQEKIEKLQTTVNLLTRSLTNQITTIDDAQRIAKILNHFAKGLDLLDNFDHKTLDTKGYTKKEAIKISTKEFLNVINRMKSEFTTDVFANPKDDSFDSSVNQIYQTFGTNECYPTLEEKAAMLLYLITKNHSFSDGNKRIAACCFLYFLEKNGILYKNNLPIIDNGTLFALTVLIAESTAQEMEIMKQIVISILNTEKISK